MERLEVLEESMFHIGEGVTLKQYVTSIAVAFLEHQCVRIWSQHRRSGAKHFVGQSPKRRQGQRRSTTHFFFSLSQRRAHFGQVGRA